jgi:hypothetical protein
MMASIIDLMHTINHSKMIDEESFHIFKRIYHVSEDTGLFRVPETFRGKLREYFGHRDEGGRLLESEDEVINRIGKQKIIKTFNKWTGEGALFNSLRAERPGMTEKDVLMERERFKQLIDKSSENCDFCQPEKYTPEDVFGRVKGKFSVTVANIAKYDAYSSLVIFRRHNPIDFNLAEFSDYIETGFSWFRKVYQHDKSFKYPFFIWNCLPRAGASQIHGHAQVLMARDQPYARVEFLRNVSGEYKKITGADYFQDLYLAHKFLGLSYKNGDTCLFANITPVKEKEMVILSRKSPRESGEFKKVIFNVLRCLIGVLGVYSFNLSISCPVMGGEDFPYLVRIVDRGSIFKSTADMGGMELYGSSVVADDPYRIIRSVKNYINNSKL